MSIPRYVSAEEYSRQSGIGVEEVKRLCRNNEIKHFMTQGGYYKIAVDDTSVPIEKFEEEHNKRIEAETTLKLLQNILLERRNKRWRWVKEKKQYTKEHIKKP